MQNSLAVLPHFETLNLGFECDKHLKLMKHLLLVFLDVADIMATHGARPHVTDERKQLVLWINRRKSSAETIRYIEVVHHKLFKQVTVQSWQCLLFFSYAFTADVWDRNSEILIIPLPALSHKLTAWSVSDARPRRRIPATLAFCSRAATFRHIHGLQIIQMREDPVDGSVQDITL